MVDRMMMRAACIAAVLAAVTACRSNPDCFGADECGGGLACIDGQCLDPDLADVNWQVDVQPIVARRCLMCHGTMLQQGAPLSLVTYANVAAASPNGGTVYERMAIRVASTASPMPPAGQAMLTEDEIAIIVAWADRGGPQGPTSGGCDGGMCTGMDGGMGPLTGAEAAQPLAFGYAGANAPVWNAAAAAVLFTDSRQDRMYQAMLPGMPMEVLNLPGGPAGLAVDAMGNLVVALSTDRSVANLTLQGAQTIAQAYEGSALNGPQDVVRRADGTLYFTDPGFNTMEAARELDFVGLFRIPMGMGAPIAEWEGLDSFEPCGLELSPDESRLYMSDRIDGLIYAFDVATDGALSTETAFARSVSGAPQGITVDSLGNVYVAANAGVEVFGPDGTYYGVIVTPDPASNVAFVDRTLTSLFVTTVNTVYVVQSMSVPGAR
ncbi:MAG: SMP-30/gluconolactonase/LRE family protein [Deltaproteobacteria bacterium]